MSASSESVFVFKFIVQNYYYLVLLFLVMDVLPMEFEFNVGNMYNIKDGCHT